MYDMYGHMYGDKDENFVVCW